MSSRTRRSGLSCPCGKITRIERIVDEGRFPESLLTEWPEALQVPEFSVRKEPRPRPRVRQPLVHKRKARPGHAHCRLSMAPQFFDLDEAAAIFVARNQGEIDDAFLTKSAPSWN